MTNGWGARRWLHIGLGVVIVGELVGGIGVVELRGTTGQAVALTDVVARFRNRQAAGPAGASAGSAATFGAVPSVTSSSTSTPLTATASTTVAPSAPAAPTSQAPDTPHLPRGATAQTTTTSTTAAPSSPAPRTPEPGVYVYATSGGDSIDALGGSRHTYPSQTTITVTTEGTAVNARWDVLKERWDAWSVQATPDGATAWTSVTTHRSFLGKTDQRAFRCAPGSTFVPPAASTAPGTTFGMHCEAGDTTMDTHGSVVGTEPLIVGDQAVQALHLLLDNTFTGGVRGTMRRAYWVVPTTGLILRVEATTDTRATLFGQDVHYLERFTLALASLTPQR